MVPMTLVVAAVLGMGGDLENGVYDFSGKNCTYCRDMDPIVRQLERNGYPIRKIECEYNQELVKRFNIRTIPAFVLVVDGQEKARLNGRVSQDELVQLCNRVPQPQGSADSLGEPAVLPRKPAPRNDDGPAPTAAPAKQPPAEKSGMSWPFGSRKKEEPTRSPQQEPVPRGKADDRPQIKTPVLGNPLAASVRIRIRDAQGDSFGSGTIIDSRVGQTTIVTCGHIFRNWDKQAVIEIDCFDGKREQTMVGRHLFHDLKADVGLITINTDSLPSCRVAPVGTKLLVGTPVIGVGCSGGEKPTVQNVKITALNRYAGAANIEVGSMPVEGRSGGGLFTKDGYVIGVCSGAEEHYKEGIFIGLKTLHDLLDRCHLGRLYRPESADDGADSFGESIVVNAPLGETGDNNEAVASEPAKAIQNRAAPQKTAKAEPQRRPVERAAAAAEEISEAIDEAGEAEVVCIIRPVNQPGAASRVVILNRASRRFVEYLADELDERPEIVETTLNSREEKPRAKKPAATQRVKRPTALAARATDDAQPAGPQAYRRQR